MEAEKNNQLIKSKTLKNNLNKDTISKSMSEVLNQSKNARYAGIQKLRKEFKTLNPKWTGKDTKAFIKFNMEQLSKRETDIVAFSENKLYNRNTGRLLNRSSVFTKTDTVRNRYDRDNIAINNDTILDIDIYLKPLINSINRAEMETDNVDIPIEFEKLNNNLSKLVAVLRPTNKKYLLKNLSTGSIWTLSSSTLSQLAERIQDGGLVQEEVMIDSSTTIIQSFYEGDDWVLQIINKEETNGVIDGGFFPYLCKMEFLDLDRYGVHFEVDHDNYGDNCLIHSVETAGYDTTAIRCLCKNQEIPMRQLKTIATLLGVYITVRRLDDEKKKTHYGDLTKPEIKLGLIEKHFFLIEEIPYTMFSIKNYDKLQDSNIEKWESVISYDDDTGNVKRKNGRNTDSYNAIKYLVENQSKCLEPIKHTDELYYTNNYKSINLFGSLDYNENIYDYADDDPTGNLMINKPMGEPLMKIKETYFFDFETTTRRNDGKDVVHKPYCCYTDKNKLGYWGELCGKKMLEDMLKKHGVPISNNKLHDKMANFETGIRLVAHNSSYDFRFLLKYLVSIDTIEKGTGLMNANSLYFSNGKVLAINIRDSLKMINMPLRKFGKCFDLNVKKEILPYDLYTEENIISNWLPIDYCLSFVSANEQDEYINNCERWGCICDGKINILKYSGEYCFMDCITLRDGYSKFGELVDVAINQDITKYMTLPSMANDYLVQKGCYDGVLKLSGVPRHFIQNCLVGGRTMCRKNQKWSIHNMALADFDAVSLYPSAMARMKGFLKGRPKVIENFDSIKNTADGYYICIRITKIGKHYDFPCVSQLTDDGIRNFTNDMVGQVVYMDNIALTDLVRFQDAEYEFINGYYYDEGFNDTICSVIREIFEERLKYKKQGNPLQLVFKELMNSSYGKTCLKPIDSDIEYVSVDAWDKFVVKNYNYIKEATMLANGLYMKVKKIKTIDTHFNNVHIGVSILSTSKTIMYEVMTLAEDLKIDMFYTDTDSIHIDNSKINYLSQKFGEKYGRDLIGNKMGQFHTDFDLDGSVGDIVASDSIFLGKKCYIDKLVGVDSKGNDLVDYHIRMKGVSTSSIKYLGDTEYDGDYMKMFQSLYEGDTLEFNLLACAPSFEMCKNMNIISKTKFDRKISFK